MLCVEAGLQPVGGAQGLAQNQFWFRTNRFTVQVMNTVMREAEKAAAKHRYYAILTFDARNTFNFLRWQDILKELEDRGCPKYMRRLLKNYFKGRKIAYLAEWR